MNATEERRHPVFDIGKIKLDLPQQFNGKGNNGEFDVFYKRMRNYMCIHDQCYGALFDYCKASYDRPIGTDHYLIFDQTLGVDQDTVARMSVTL